MKLGISVRLGLLLALISVLAAGLTGYAAYAVSRDLLVDSAKHELLTSTRVLARRIALTREEVSRNLSILATHPGAAAALREADPTAKDQMAVLFHRVMEANPRYFQVRLIAARDYGRESVRIDRDGDRLLRVVGEDLQEKGHYPYVFDTLKLAAGKTRMSSIAINHEDGVHAGREQPTVQLATPVVGDDGVTLGVVVISVDLNGMFSLLAADLPSNYQLFLANRQGDFLIHPDPERSFGFDKGRRVLVSDEFPETRDLVKGRVEQVLVEAREGRHANIPVLAAFISSPVRVASDETRLILGLAEPLSVIQAQVDRLGVMMARIVLGLCVICILLAALMARAITRPINSMSAAVQGFAEAQRADGLPLGRQDEIGVLARAFDHMRAQIIQQLAALRRNQEELEHLARHDVLTGLPNRALFAERMEQALAIARRDRSRLALMFIDLDQFKPVNDNLGHAVGDALLKEIAARIRAVLRESDTAARIGGDEFMVLLHQINQVDDAITVAEKIRQAIRAPCVIAPHTVSVSASIGIAVHPEDGADMLTLSRHADQAMYLAKERGRDAVVSYQAAVQAAATRV